MTTETSLFYVFAGILLFASYRVITARSAVYAALFLVLAFFNAACVWMLLHAEFLAITLVLVYVGAVMVLFLFVVMMLDDNTDTLRHGARRHLPLALVIGAVIAFEMSIVLLRGFRVSDVPATTPEALKLGNTKMVGIEIYTHYLYPLQIAAVLLLVAIIAAIALTLRKRKDSRYLDPAAQIAVKRADRVRIVQMKAEVAPPPAPPQDGGTA
jgi:NADH-quinone oxidoreductase subunit J